MLNKKSVPNLLVFCRLALIPFFVWAFESGKPLLALTLFSVAAITDFFDGYLARKWNATSKLGAMLDQISDKLLVCAALLCLVAEQGAWLVPALVIILREIWVSGLREYMGEQGIAMPVSKLGKWKTATQMLGLFALLSQDLCLELGLMGNLLLTIAAFLSSISAWQYSRALKFSKA